MSPVLRGSMQQFGTSVFTAYTVLANERKAVNLSQGFPDFEPPEPLLAAARDALAGGFSQYAPADGDVALRTAVAGHQASAYGQSWDPVTEVTVTCGATEAIWTVVQALVDPGQEVVLFEPYYDSYAPPVVAVGAVPRVVPNSGFPDFRLDLDRLADTMGPATRLVILNTPWNPIGRRISAEELRVIGELCQRHGAYLLSDETYEHLVYGVEHRPAVSEPLLADRTITVSSVSKTFSATGWRVGWAVAPAELTDALRRVHQFVTFTAPAPLQRAAAVMLAGAGPDFYAGLSEEFRQRRDLLLAGLRPLPLELGTPEATYFVLGRCDGDEKEWCVDLIDRVGVAAIPASALYGDPANGRGLVRFTFCKKLSTLTEAADRIAAAAG